MTLTIMEWFYVFGFCMLALVILLVLMVVGAIGAGIRYIVKRCKKDKEVQDE